MRYRVDLPVVTVIAFFLLCVLPVYAVSTNQDDFLHKKPIPTIIDDHGITFPRADESAPIHLVADQCRGFQEGHYYVWYLEGNAVLTQGKDSVTAQKMILWCECVPQKMTCIRRVILYAQEDVSAQFITLHTASSVKDSTWMGRFKTGCIPDVKQRISREKSSGQVNENTPFTLDNYKDLAHAQEELKKRASTEDVSIQDSIPETLKNDKCFQKMYKCAKKNMDVESSVILAQYTQPQDMVSEDSSPDTRLQPETLTEKKADSVMIESTSGDVSGIPVAPTDNYIIPSGSAAETEHGRAVIPEALSSPRLEQGDVSALDPNVPPPGKRRVSFFSRSDTQFDFSWKYDSQQECWVGVLHKGVNIVIQGINAPKNMEKLLNTAAADGSDAGTLDILTDRMVIWASGTQEKPDMQGLFEQDSNARLELYMEGNIIFRQGGRTIHADRMYYDVRDHRGLVREAQIFTPVPNVDGTVRISAQEVRIPEEGVFMAQDTYVTTSQMGDPYYRFQMGQLTLRDQRTVRTDPLTGKPMYDPRTGEEIVDGPHDITGTDTVIKIGNVPVFYMPYFSAPLENPLPAVNAGSIRSDSIFGVQLMLGVDAYRLFGIQNAPEGTSWDIQGDYYSKRGPGFGTDFRYDRDNQDIPLGWFTGPGHGFLNFWGIYDTGKDNIGLHRRDLEPETQWRYQVYGRHRNSFGYNFELLGQFAAISDRNFQQEYFQNSWYTEKDRATQLEIRQQPLDNLVWSIWTDVRVNNFHTQTQRTPQLELYWLGQPLFYDRLTWSSYSQVGYVHLFPDTYPTAPQDRDMFNLLEWEKNRKGYRASTRQEISYPFQAGAVKVVPYALGELAAWEQDLNENSVTRAYGQVGIRASLPFWKAYTTENKLLNVHGIMHKVEFDIEASYSKANRDPYTLPLYDLIDDRSILDFRHHMGYTTFNSMYAPEKFDSRSYAIRSNLGGWVTSPSTELADDLVLIKFGMHHRWQTKRGLPGHEQIIDWITLDFNFNLYPDYDRDNFGSLIGLMNYDVRWHAGDRLTFYSSGNFDFFADGLKMVDVGGILERPNNGSAFMSVHYLSGPVNNVVLRMGYNYWMTEKWASTFITTFDISGKGDIGQSLAFTRIGESMLLTFGATYDAPSDNFGFSFTLEPRFGSKGKFSELFGIPAVGSRGLE